MKTIIKKIIDHSTEYACDLIQDTGQCYPFGAFVDKAEIVHPLEFDIESVDNVPNNETVINSLIKYCEGELTAKRIIAYGITCEAVVTLSEDTDPIETIAIDIHVNNDKQPSVYYFPYTINNQILTYGEPFAVLKS